MPKVLWINGLFLFAAMTRQYEPEKYWNEVANRIGKRGLENMMAGDDEPYYHYKRKKFLRLFTKIPFSNKIVLEVGCGPGANILEVLKFNPQIVHGADISDEMLSLASQFLPRDRVVLTKVTSQRFPFSDQYFKLSYTVTVLQHNTSLDMLESTIAEMCRVTEEDIYIFERIEKSIRGSVLCLGRPVTEYQRLFAKHGFVLQKATFLNIQVSYVVCGTIRKLFNQRKRKEGEPLSGISILLQKAVLPFTSRLDELFKAKRELAMLHFQRKPKSD